MIPVNNAGHAFLHGTLYIDIHDNVYHVDEAGENCLWYGVILGGYNRHKDFIITQIKSKNKKYKLLLFKEPEQVYNHSDIVAQHPNIIKPME